MINLKELQLSYISAGYSELLAEARVCQDMVLKAISESTMRKSITIKGGVVMRSISGDVRRATRDIDFDFIRYSIDEGAIRQFVDRLNCLEGVTFSVSGPVEELSQQEYRGKRIWVIIKDANGNALKTKMDLGVHKNMQIEQEEYCFDICQNEDKVCLLVNSKEQIFAEKLRALVKFGTFTGRLKDIFDMCYLAEEVDKERLRQCIHTYILDDSDMYENSMSDVRKRMNRIFSDKEFMRSLGNSKRDNWLNMKNKDATQRIMSLLDELE